MKKTCFALTLALILALACVSAQAAQYDPISFGDFSIAIDPGMPYSGLEEKKDNEVWFTLYPNYQNNDESTNFNVVWTQETANISSYKESDRDGYVAMLEQGLTSQYESIGLTMKSFSVPEIYLDKIDGKDALAYIMISEVEYAGQTFSLYQLQAVVSDTFGTYTFTGTASTLELLEAYVDPLFDTITWNR